MKCVSDVSYVNPGSNLASDQSGVRDFHWPMVSANWTWNNVARYRVVLDSRLILVA